MKVFTDEEFEALCEIEKHLNYLSETVEKRGKKVGPATISEVVTRVGQLRHASMVLVGLVAVEKRVIEVPKPSGVEVPPNAIEKKIQPEPFRQILDGTKTAELRLGSDDYAVGEFLHLREWCPKKKDYTGKSVLTKITHIDDLSTFKYYDQSAIKAQGLLVLHFNGFERVHG